MARVTNPDPIAPTQAEALGFNDRRYNVEKPPPAHGTLVQGGHSKVSQDPSEGTATSRTQVMERSGARYRIHPPVFTPNVPFAAATQANGRIVGGAPATDYAGSKEYGPGTEAEFDDAPTISSRAPGSHRMRGWTQRG